MKGEPQHQAKNYYSPSAHPENLPIIASCAAILVNIQPDYKDYPLYRSVRGRAFFRLCLC